MIKCESIKLLKYCSVPVTLQYFFYIIVTLPDDGRNYWPKHVIVKVINK